MPKIKIPKSSPSIDMTPMVDLAFLLVTFFMLAANFRSNEPVQVETPSSTASDMIPENVLLITIDKGGRVFMNIKDAEARKEMLANMSSAYKIQLNEKQVEKFSFMESFGCSMQELPAYIDMGPEERKRFETKGISVDTLANGASQLKDWIAYANRAALNSGRTKFEEAEANGENPEINDFKPKFVLKVDSKTLYLHAKTVIDVFRDLNLTNLNFVTSMEKAPN